MPTFEIARLDDAEVIDVSPGISARPLTISGLNAMVVEFAPGACWVGVDRHDSGPENAFVLEGVLEDGIAEYPAGTLVHGPKGSSHVPQSRSGCKVLIWYPQE